MPEEIEEGRVKVSLVEMGVVLIREVLLRLRLETKE